MQEEITEEKTIENMEMELIAQECSVSTDDVMEYPPTALSLGEKTIQTKNGDINIPIGIGTYGNFSFVQAPPKTKKTFFISLLASVYLSGQNNFGGKIKGHRDGRCLIHFDTEQGHWHAQRVFKRVEDMAGIKDLGCYQTYALRTINYKQRMKFIEYTLEQNKGNNGLVVIDGIADLVSDVNNLEESNLCVQKIMELSAKYDCHIITVIHSNYGTDKATGHLGSFLYKKCETAISLEQNTVHKDNVTATCKISRGYAFDTFSFSVNRYGLPFVVGDIYDPLQDFKTKQPKHKEIPFKMSQLINKAAEKHKTWINVVNSFGCPKQISEDIVQEMYIYLIRYEKEGKDIWYEDGEVNYYYIFKQLRGIYVAYLRQNSKITKVTLEEIDKQFEEIDPLEYEEQYQDFLNGYLRAVDDVYWYDKKVFELIARGKSVAELSRDTKIGYYSLYNTYNKVKNKLKDDLL